ncbi:uncharacterized protein (TIGR02646 family) [Roseinatronobacter thiooxidans]|uniref:Uncharacterized protein (TIGR02646 family) n=1 Tax=Roseinatronobacter thiooxidans TaxID=121821 RepID=A0A2W7PU50_9RHOB|nr:hypothetical protein [Roseinatronobacter thiooxidans]PZX38976.1 uncharacterized protein (TIGR02646 family) [Roseinatronobacter thiooxidans]
MLNLDACAQIIDAVLAAVETVLNQPDTKGWSSQAKCVNDFKYEIMTQGLQMQGSRCVWCTLEVAEKGHRTAHRDHIAPKNRYAQWTFTPMNLVISCEYCNGFKVKGELDTVSVCAEQYADSEFVIVHPYIDDTSIHIRFVDNEAGHPILIEGLSDRGTWTIETMSLDSTHMTKQRAKDFIFARETEALAEADLDILKRALNRRV